MWKKNPQQTKPSWILNIFAYNYLLIAKLPYILKNFVSEKKLISWDKNHIPTASGLHAITAAQKIYLQSLPHYQFLHSRNIIHKRHQVFTLYIKEFVIYAIY